jgi:hypothetical protein
MKASSAVPEIEERKTGAVPEIGASKTEKF